MMRHGKSSWDYEVSDKDRPLMEKGIDDAYRVAKEYREKNHEIDFAFSSPANRALHTCMIFLRNQQFGLDKLRVTEALYDFSGSSVERFVGQLDNAWDTVAIFGHNYAFTSLANAWGDQYIENVPTAGLVHLRFNVEDWSKISKGVTEQTIFPKYIKR